MVRELLSGVAVIALGAGAQMAQAQTAQPAGPVQQSTTGSPATATDAASAAQAAGPTDNLTTDRNGGLQEIVVTATRRSVDLQKVAATVTALPASTLKTFNVTGVLQLPTLTSGLVIAPSGGNNLYLRGIGSASSGYNEAQVAVYVDGLYLANPALGIYSFNNIDQIEVLKGPQGTLYGRNVTGGLISVATRNPGKELRIDASAGYANYDTVSANLYASVPLTETLAANVAFFHQKQSKGWGRNLFTGNDDQKSNETGVQSKLAWHPTSSTKVTASFIYDFNNRDVGYAYEVLPGTLGADGTPYLGKYRHVSRIDANAPFHAYIGSLRIEQDLGFANLMSLTGYQKSRTNLLFAGGLPVLGQPIAGQSGAYNPFLERNRTWSQEFQLTSAPNGSRFDWVAGAFYYNDHTFLQLDSYNTCVGNVCAPGAAPQRNTGRPTTLSYSGYGDATYRFFTATKVTVGLRYTDETKELSGLVTPLAGRPNSVLALPAAATATTAGTVFFPGQPFPGYPNGIPTKLHFTKLTYRAVLAQDFGEHVHAYVSHNLGFKSGAFNGNLFSNPPARPELLYATEAGVKSELFDRRLRLNVAYFHYTYKNVQVRSLAPPALPGTPILQNAAKELMNGVDVDFTFTPLRGLIFTGSAEYLHARYADFPGASCTSPGTRTVNGVLVGVVTSVTCNLAGYKVAQAAPFSGTIGASYSLDTPSGVFTLSANDHYTSRYPGIQDASIYQERHHLVDASLNWVAPNKRYDVNLFVRNLTKAYVYAAFSGASSYAIVPGAPRTFGGTVGFHY